MLQGRRCTARTLARVMFVQMLSGLLLLGFSTNSFSNTTSTDRTEILEASSFTHGRKIDTGEALLAQSNQQKPPSQGGPSYTPNYNIDSAFGNKGSGDRANPATDTFSPTKEELKLCELKRRRDSTEKLHLEYTSRMQKGLAAPNEDWVRIANDAAQAEKMWSDYYFSIGYNEADWTRKEQFIRWCEGLTSNTPTDAPTASGPEKIKLRITATGYDQRDVVYTAPEPISALNIDGRVVDPKGKPVEGAKIELLESSFTDTSLSDGRFNISAAGTDKGAPFSVSGDITLTPEIPFAIKILDTDARGKPYAGLSADGESSLTAELTGPASIDPALLELKCFVDTDDMLLQDKSKPCSPLSKVGSKLQFSITPPEKFKEPYSIQIDLAVTSDDGTSRRLDDLGSIPVIHPPVVLIHGIWSSRDAMIPMRTFLDNTGHFKIITTADYSTTSYNDIRTNVGALRKAINAAFQQMESRGIKGKQVDVVAHSLGGLIARLYMLGYTDKSGRPVAGKLGQIRKLITLGTPHLGSTLGDWYAELDPPGMFECSGITFGVSDWKGSHEPYKDEYEYLLKYIREAKGLKDDALKYGVGARQLSVHSNPIIDPLNKAQRALAHDSTEYHLVAGTVAFFSERVGNKLAEWTPKLFYDSQLYSPIKLGPCGQTAMSRSFEKMFKDLVSFTTQRNTDGVVSINSALASTTGIKPTTTKVVPFNHFNITDVAPVWKDIYSYLVGIDLELIGTYIFKGSPGILTITDAQGRELGPAINDIPNATYTTYESITGNHTLAYIPEGGEYTIQVEANETGKVTLEVNQGDSGGWHWTRYEDVPVEPGSKIMLKYSSTAPEAQTVNAGGDVTSLEPKFNEIIAPLQPEPEADADHNGTENGAPPSKGQDITANDAVGQGGVTNGNPQITRITGQGELVTDAKWQATIDIPDNDAWMYPGFDDSGWQNAVADWRLKPSAATDITGMQDTTAGWIWHPDDPDLAYFRREFELAYQPAEAVLRITADNEYAVYLNGGLIGEDAGNQSSVWQNAESYEIARFLRKGRNVISVVAKDLGGGSGLLMDLRFGGPSILPGQRDHGEAALVPSGVSEQSVSTNTMGESAESLEKQGSDVFSQAFQLDDERKREEAFAKALSLFQQAQSMGSAEAIYMIGYMYETGNGVPQDNDIAVSHYEEAARSGYAEAYRHLILVQNQLRRYEAAALTFLRYYKAFPQHAEQGFADFAFSPQVLRAVQRELRDTGYYQGAIDGIIGRGTRGAIRQYVAEQLPDEMIHSDYGSDYTSDSETGPRSTADESIQLAFWQSIESSDEPADFDAYLAKWPNGVFADLARNRLNRLSGNQPARNPPASTPGTGERYYTPTKGSEERRAIMDAARGPISAELDQPVVFVVDALRSDGHWAFLQAVPQHPDGTPVNWDATQFAGAWRADMMTDVVMMLLEKRDGRMQVVDYVIGPTDVYWYGWIDQYGLSEMFFYPQSAE